MSTDDAETVDMRSRAVLRFARPSTSAARPDRATAISYVLFVEIDERTKERRILISGVHEDAFARTAAGWRLTRRTVVADI
ncbi:nuclear transport factor 2 family protein [Actinophytocola sp.]|uniref:nuclear transport factor 2 family protein n=1 Tax=Actinophytocola sp. TaxID=1872138 RepID=UPI00389AE449